MSRSIRSAPPGPMSVMFPDLAHVDSLPGSLAGVINDCVTTVVTADFSNSPATVATANVGRTPGDSGSPQMDRRTYGLCHRRVITLGSQRLILRTASLHCIGGTAGKDCTRLEPVLNPIRHDAKCSYADFIVQFSILITIQGVQGGHV